MGLRAEENEMFIAVLVFMVSVQANLNRDDISDICVISEITDGNVNCRSAPQSGLCSKVNSVSMTASGLCLLSLSRDTSSFFIITLQHKAVKVHFFILSFKQS